MFFCPTLGDLQVGKTKANFLCYQNQAKCQCFILAHSGITDNLVSIKEVFAKQKI